MKKSCLIINSFDKKRKKKIYCFNQFKPSKTFKKTAVLWCSSTKKTLISRCTLSSVSDPYCFFFADLKLVKNLNEDPDPDYKINVKDLLEI